MSPRRRPSARVAPSLALAWALLPQASLAHSSIQGMDGFDAGLLHPLLVPAHALTLVGLGLLMGQQGKRHMQMALPVFVVALVLPLALHLTPSPPLAASLETTLLALAALSGTAAAAAPRLPPLVSALTAAACGLAIALDSSPDAPTAAGQAAALAGTALGATMALLYLVLLADLPRRPWQRIAVRILGSWTAASAIMVLALTAARQ
jgi:urease accessory protein